MRVRRTLFSLSLAMAAAIASPLLAEKVVRKTLPLDPGGEVRIDTYKGSIVVSAGTAAEVEVVARVTPDGDDHDQPRKVDETEIRIHGGGQSVSIESDYDRVHSRGFFGWGDKGTLPLVHYTIRMPAGARLVVDDYKSDSKVTGIADVSFETYKGTARLSGLHKEAQVETYKGEVQLEFDAFQGARLETYKGRIVVRVPKDARFDVDADRGRRGDVDSDFPLDASSRRRGRDDDEEERLRASVNGGGPRLAFSTYKGSLELRAR